jgi:hypothetical protein
MKRNNLTTVDDFKQTWDTAAKDREAYRRGESGRGAVTRQDIARAFERSASGRR